MSSAVREHYAKHLGPVYAWMLGGVGAACRRGAAELDALRIDLKAGGWAVDLGAGFGMHAIPLARRGWSVLAVDSDAGLLRELKSQAPGLPIAALEADLMNFRAHLERAPRLILCMGDTLTHLPSTQALESLFGEVAAALAPGGTFVATFRDYRCALQGEQRFIQVRSDADRILTCFLEYADGRLTVHDLLQEREGSEWRLRVSSYQKLRLEPDWVAGALAARGLTVSREAAPGGMIRLLAQRAPASAPTRKPLRADPS